MGGGACRRGTPACAHAPCWSVVREGFLEDMSELRPEDGQELPRVHWGRWGMRLTNTAFILKALLNYESPELFLFPKKAKEKELKQFTCVKAKW